MLSPSGTTDSMFVAGAGLKPAPTLSSLTGLAGLLCRSVPAMNRRPTIEASILDASGLYPPLAEPTPLTLAEQKTQSIVRN